MVDRKALETELKQAATREWAKAEATRKKLKRGKSFHQREIEKINKRIEEMKQKYMVNPHLREIEKKFTRQIPVINASALECPICHGSDEGNVMNGKPWCFKCNVALEPKKPKNKAKKELIIRLSRKRLADLVHLGLRPDNKEEEN